MMRTSKRESAISCIMILIGGSLTLLPITPVREASAQLVSEENWLAYDNAERGLRMSYPSNWEKDDTVDVNPNDDFSDIVKFYRPSDNDSKPRDSVLVFIDERNLQNITVDDYLSKLIRVKQYIPGFAIIESTLRNVTLANSTAYKLVYTYKAFGIDTKVMEIGTIIGDKAYILRYSAEEENYSKHLPDILKMIGSLEIDEASTQAASRILTYENPVMNIRVQYPSDWQKIEYDNGVRIYHPRESAQDKYAETLDLYAFGFGPNSVFPSINTTLDEVAGNELNFLEKTKLDFNLIVSRPIEFNNTGVAAHMFLYNFVDRYIGLSKVMAIVTIKGDTMYVLEYLAKPDQYDDYLPTVQKIINSFQITNGISEARAGNMTVGQLAD